MGWAPVVLPPPQLPGEGGEYISVDVERGLAHYVAAIRGGVLAFLVLGMPCSAPVPLTGVQVPGPPPSFP